MPFWDRGWTNHKGTESHAFTAEVDLLPFQYIKESVPGNYMAIPAITRDEAIGYVLCTDRGVKAGEKVEIMLGEWDHPVGTGSAGGTVITVSDDGNGVVVVDNTDPTNPVITFPGVFVTNSIIGNGNSFAPLQFVNDQASPGADQVYGTDGAGNKTWKPDPTGTPYTDEEAQDAVGLIGLDTQTVNFTYNDGAPSMQWDVITQMSVDQDAGGVKLVNDNAAPPADYHYGTDALGVKGWIPDPTPGTGVVATIQEGENVDIDSTDPVNPIVNACTEDVQFIGECSDTFSGTMNDYNPAGLTLSSTLRLNATGANPIINRINGIVGGTKGRLLVIHNVGFENIRFSHEAGGSAPANRFFLLGLTALILKPNEMIWAQYDLTLQRWKLGGVYVPYFEVTYSQATVLLGGYDVVPGGIYKITDRADTGIVVQGFSSNQFSLQGEGGFWIPDWELTGDYSGVPGWSGFGGLRFVWQAINETGGTGPYNNGDIVFWNNFHYVVINAGAMNGTDPATNGAAYQQLSKQLNHGYKEEWDYIEYDLFPGDWINVRKDKRNNEIGGTKAYEQNAGNGFNVIEKFQWGHSAVYSNYSRESLFVTWNNATAQIANNRIYDNSIVLCDNYGPNPIVGPEVSNNVISQQSFVDLTNANGSFTNNFIYQFSQIYGSDLQGSMGNSTITRTEIHIENSTGGIFNNVWEYAGTQDLSTYGNFNFSYNQIRNNSVLNSKTGQASITGNTLLNASILNCDNITADVGQNLLKGSRVDCSTTGEQVTNNTFEDNANVTCSKAPGFPMSNCRFSGPFTVTVDANIAYDGQVCERDKNTFQCPLDISGLTTIDFLSVASCCGVILLSSSGASENIDHIVNNPTTWPIKYISDDGLAVTWKHSDVATIVADEIALENNTDAVCTGRPQISDFIVISRENGVNRQITGSIII